MLTVVILERHSSRKTRKLLQCVRRLIKAKVTFKGKLDGNLVRLSTVSLGTKALGKPVIF